MRYSTEHHLNYVGLSSLQFEELCFWLLEAQGHTDVEHWGAAGSEKGCDLVSRAPDGKRWVTQCKRVQSFVKSEALKELEKVLKTPPSPLPEVYFLVASCPISRTVKEALGEKLAGAMELKTWDLTKLDKRVRDHPEVVKRWFGVVPPVPDQSNHWTVPYRRNPYFVGREEILEQLRERLTRDGSAALGQTQAISGLGGIGKTQTAVEYAYRYREEYQAVFFVRADTEAEILTGFSELARKLGLGEAQEQEKVVAAALAWLRGNDAWLLIFDNADKPELVKPYVPADHRGHVLVTSRARVFVTLGIADPFEMATLPPIEALEFLLKRAARAAPEPHERTAAEALAAELGYLPLALEQAGAFILEKQSSFQDYLWSYRKRGLELLELGQPQVEGHTEPVATTWSLNFREIERTSPASAGVLQASAFLSPDDIPLELLEGGGYELGRCVARALGLDRPWWKKLFRSRSLPPEGPPTLVIDEILEPLTKYSLVTRNVDARTYSVHRLVQDVIKRDMEAPNRRVWTKRVVRALNRAFPNAVLTSWPLCDRLVPHAQVAEHLVKESSLDSAEAVRLFNEAGIYLSNRARYDDAKLLLSRSIEIGERVLRKDHPDMAAGLMNLGKLYSDMSHYEEAEPLFLRSLEMKEEVLGENHPSVAKTLLNLGNLYHTQGRYEEGELPYLRSLEIAEKALGEDHPDVAQSLSNLGTLYLAQGRHDEAEPLFLRSLEIFEKALGKYSPELARTLGNLGNLYRALGRYEEAEPLYLRSLETKAKVLGQDHPEVSQAQGNLALLFTDQGRHKEAEPLYLRSLEIEEKTLGKDHPDVARILNNLGLLYWQQGRYAEAEPLFLRSLETRRNALGESHPEVAHTLGNLGNIYSGQGQYGEAEPFYQRGLEICEKAFGSAHPQVALALMNLGSLYLAQGRFGEAEPFYRRSLEIFEKALDNRHPHVLILLTNYATLLRATGREDEADELMVQAGQSDDG